VKGLHFPVVKAVDDLSWLKEIKRISSETITIARMTHQWEGCGAVDDPDTDLDRMADGIIGVIADKLAVEPDLREAADYWEAVNEPDATAPAQQAFIIDCLDPHLDWMTPRVEEISFGDITLTNPHETPVFYERVTIPDYREEEDKQWWVDVRTEFDVEFGCLRLTMRTLDPETGQLPEDPSAGFLPPEDGAGRGQGYITFSALTKREVPHDTVVKNQGAIKFDTNDPMLTNEVFNTVLNLYIKRLRPRSCEPGDVIKIVGHNFGATQGNSLVHIGKRVFDSTSPRIVLWSDTRIKIRVPKYKCTWFKGKELRRTKVWVTVEGMVSNGKRLKVMKSATCE